MRSPRLFLVDVFAQSALTGNPLAVVVSDAPIAEPLMQSLAAEINFSETTFVQRRPSAGAAYRVRMFTPAREVDFAGHPILGTAWVLRRHVAKPRGGSSMRLALNGGVVPVSFEGRGKALTTWFTAPPIRLGARFPPATVARALGVLASDIDRRFPVQVAGAGTRALLVPLRSLEALRRARLDLNRLAPLIAAGAPSLAYLFCADARCAGNHLTARFFFEANGVREDPATGNGAAFLGAYLMKHRLLGSGPLDLRIEQGADVGRPSLVRLRAGREAGRLTVSVGGAVLSVAQGRLSLGC